MLKNRRGKKGNPTLRPIMINNFIPVQQAHVPLQGKDLQSRTRVLTFDTSMHFILTYLTKFGHPFTKINVRL